MTPKEKALDLYNKMLQWQDDLEIYLQNDIICIAAKKCAIITVDEILSVIWIDLDDRVDYWAEVKQEIENIKNQIT